MTSLANRALAVALVVQGALVALTWTTGGSEPVGSRLLLEFDPETVTALTITGRTDGESVPAEPVSLVRGDDGWALQSDFGYPATPENVALALDPLADLQVRAPIATQAYHHPSLEVSPEHFTRKVQITTTSGEHVLYLGAASGRGLNVRLEGDDEVFSVRGVSAWGIPDHDNRYFDRSVFKITASMVASLTVIRPGEEPIELVRDDSGWISPGLRPGQDLDAARVDSFVSGALTLRMLEPAASVEAPEHGLASGVVVSWTTRDGDSSQTNRYRIGAARPGATEQFYVRWDAQPWVLAVRRGTLIDALETTFDDLLATPEP